MNRADTPMREELAERRCAVVIGVSAFGAVYLGLASGGDAVRATDAFAITALALAGIAVASPISRLAPIPRCTGMP